MTSRKQKEHFKRLLRNPNFKKQYLKNKKKRLDNKINKQFSPYIGNTKTLSPAEIDYLFEPMYTNERIHRHRLYYQNNWYTNNYTSVDYIKQKYDCVDRELTYEDIKKLPNFEQEYYPVAVKAVLEVKERIKQKGINFKFGMVRLTINQKEDTSEKSLSDLKEIVETYHELKRWDSRIKKEIIGEYLNFEIGDEGKWHMHITVFYDVWGVWDLPEKDREDYIREKCRYYQEYWYRMIGRTIGEKGISVEESVMIGKGEYWIDISYPKRPYQYWYVNHTDDRNNVVDYLLYQAKTNERMREFRQSNPRTKLYYISI